MSTRLVRRTWHGDELLTRARRADGRAILGMAERVSDEQTRAAHVKSGDLRRSVHAARRDTLGEVAADTPDAVQMDSDGDDYQVEIGSWLPYACVENNRGGEHRFADIGWEAARGDFEGILIRAWREEGL